ncbi:hypothetical protein HH_1538 [Helicobacter hepaticus ATCC 51449]|uniref:Uncharacterized protein n=1 Tax=Helicobacter hepaticus (strain ATCC 51449 / 3B1) TaxID=235279 RepID=Q7VFY7_HELHP|nr:hypothetical protein HH_1538 [Helicobacter hepaticus ATCC 51449]
MSIIKPDIWYLQGVLSEIIKKLFYQSKIQL